MSLILAKFAALCQQINEDLCLNQASCYRGGSILLLNQELRVA